ncbi:peptidoglycan-associated lipoprotein Pal [Desulfomicrobium orale]|uniref:peptidoglycan-associated lipoprotein Pal n=1 Tax=Desulfomicrobium orale TaxID=132132 RepID=UPI0009FA1F09|nr:peptidoglycan-associated lipoprotein Pal [Desulfomicrobium orale]
MRKLNVFGLIVLVFCLALAGGCSKKVGSTPAGGMGAGSDSMSGQGGMGGDMDSQRLMEMQRQAIEKISADRIYFAFDSNELSQESRQILTEKVELLKANPSLNLLIEGHCDERGTNEYNLALGERRARAAYEFLVLMGISSSRLSIISYGEEYPAVQGGNEAAWAKNRRDEFKASAN